MDATMIPRVAAHRGPQRDVPHAGGIIYQANSETVKGLSTQGVGYALVHLKPHGALPRSLLRLRAPMNVGHMQRLAELGLKLADAANARSVEADADFDPQCYARPLAGQHLPHWHQRSSELVFVLQVRSWPLI